MADVAPSGVSGVGKKIIKQAGAAISEGDWVYADAADSGKMKPASNAAVASAAVRGVAMNDAADDSDVIVLVDGYYDPGVVLVSGLMYVLGVDGAMAPVEDHTGAVNGASKAATFLGRGTSTGTLRINIDLAEALQAE